MRSYRHLKWGLLVAASVGLWGSSPQADTVNSAAETAAIENAVAANAAPASPATRTIAELRQHLANYEAIAAKGGWLKFPRGDKLEEGDNSARVAIARNILRTMGDYKDPYAVPDDQGGEGAYNAAMKEAVASFQRRHALDDDGVLGRKTQAALAIPVERRIAEIRATLEKMESYTPPAERYVFVNLPAYTLRVMENGTEVMNSRVIVGRPDRATPLLEREINQITFNPIWHVPHKIASRDVLEHVQKDPEYLQKGGFTVLAEDENGESQSVDPSSIDWTQVSSDNFPYRLRQRSGSDNALGKVKFNIPGTDDIYLHSTSKPELFAKAQRDLSSGCIRVEKAYELAHYLLDNAPGWNPERVKKMLSHDNPSYVPVKNPITVKVVYWPVWVEEGSGTLHFSPDIYRHLERRVAQLMEQKPGAEVELALK